MWFLLKRVGCPHLSLHSCGALHPPLPLKRMAHQMQQRYCRTPALLSPAQTEKEVEPLLTPKAVPTVSFPQWPSKTVTVRCTDMTFLPLVPTALNFVMAPASPTTPSRQPWTPLLRSLKKTSDGSDKENLPPKPLVLTSHVCAVGLESAASVSDDAFFSSGAQTDSGQSTSCSLSSHSETYVMSPLTNTSSSIPTEETSGSGTVVPLTYQREGTLHLDSSAGAGHLAFTSDLLSRTTRLTRSCTVRRDGTSSVSYSLSSLSGLESSDRENTSRHNHSRSHSEYSHSDDFQHSGK